MLDEGRFASVGDLAEAERVNLSCVSRILRTTLLAPDIVERILDGCLALRLAELMQPCSVSGAREHSDRLCVQSGKELSRLKRSHMARYASCWTK
jgi:hypothetical protein